MKPHIYIHKNLYARGFGLTIVREGPIVFNFWLWCLSGCFYFGKRLFIEESLQNKRLREAEVSRQQAWDTIKILTDHVNTIETERAYATRDVW